MLVRNSYSCDCPTRMVLDRVADKWTVLVLGLLIDGSVRFNGLRRTVEGISQKMLSQTLKSLERDGLVSRKAIAAEDAARFQASGKLFKGCLLLPFSARDRTVSFPCS